MCISADGVAHNKSVGYTYAQKVIKVHNGGVLCYALKYGNITCFAVVDVSKGGLCSRTVRVHYGAVILISRRVLAKLAECTGKNALVLIFYSLMYLTFCGGGTESYICVRHFKNSFIQLYI